MNKTTFKDILNNIKSPKHLTAEEKMPSIFDLYWDAKCGEQVFHLLNSKFTKTAVSNQLAISGYDVKQALKDAEKFLNN